MCYGQRVHGVERTAFTFLVFSSTGGMGTECTTFYKCLSSMLLRREIALSACNHLTEMQDCHPSIVIMAIRGSRSAKRPLLVPGDIPRDVRV